MSLSNDAYHPLVDTSVLSSLQIAVNRHGTRILESVPTPTQLSHFFAELQTHTDDQLHRRLFFNGEDGTVFIRHTAAASDLSSSPYHINLCTVAHDYTRSSRTPFHQDDSTWPSSYDGTTTDLVAASIVPMLDDLQRHLLTRLPAYFHSASLSEHEETTGGNVTYSLRTAYRVSAHAEPALTDGNALSWHPLGWAAKATRRATPAEATLWAICHVVPTDARADILRLRHIHATVRAVFGVGDSSMKRRAIPLGNSLALLGARLPPRHDGYGRVRYAMLRGAVCDQSLLGRLDEQGDSEQTRLHTFVLGQEEHKRSLPVVSALNSKASKFGMDMGAVVRIGCSLLFLMVFIGIATFYTVSRIDSRSVLVQWILWGLVIISVFEIFFMCFSLLSTKGKTLKSLVSIASRTENVKLQIDMASSIGARFLYDGKWLSFTGNSYEGNLEYEGRRFNISDLMMAGYETTYCMDGREALVVPRGDSVVRMLRLDEMGSAVFGRSESDSAELSTGIVPGVRGTWVSDVVVSRDMGDDKRPPPPHFV